MKRRNPGLLGLGNVGEATKLVGATIAINFASASFVMPIAARFVPGQFAQPVSLWATGQGLGWLAGMTSFTRPFSSALKLMGWVLGIGALVTPIVSGFLNRGRAAGPQGWPSNGRAGWARGPNGWAVVTGTPPQILSPAQAAQAAGPNGWATMRQGYRNA